MTKVNAEICVLRPADTVGVVETLIKNGFAAVIRANAYDEAAETIFVHAYGESSIPNLPDNNRFDPDESDDAEAADLKLYEYLGQLLAPTGCDITECGPGHEDTMGQVVPPVGLQFAIDVLDDHNGIKYRISCAEYAPDRFVMMMIQAAGLLANTHGKSVGNALMRRILLAALGPIEDEDEDDGDEGEILVGPKQHAA